MHNDTSDLGIWKVCTCEECQGWGKPPRKPQMGKHGPPISWRGKWYHRMRTGHYRHAKGILLHRAIWGAHFGSIPEGFHVHHIDGNSGNNEPTNLELLSAKQHNGMHEPRGFRNFSPEVRGIYSKQAWKQRTWVEFECLSCGKVGTTPYPNRRKFCNGTCEARYKSLQKITTRTCDQCGKEFSARDPRRTYCSQKCYSAAYGAKKRLQPTD